MKLSAINDEGVEFELLDPFFRALLPAFAQRAEQIRIEPDDSGVRICYDSKCSSAPFDSSLHNYGAIAFSRILILSAMSIALEGSEQAGRFRVRYDQQVVPIDVAARRDASAWYLIFRPAWGTRRVRWRS